MTVELDPPLDGDGFEIAFVRLRHVGLPQTLYDHSPAEANLVGRKKACPKGLSEVLITVSIVLLSKNSAGQLL